MKERIITGLIMALVALLGITLLPTWLFQLVLLLVALVGMSEWQKMMHISIRYTYGLLNTILLVVTYLLLLAGATGLLLTVNTMAAYLWLLVPLILFSHIKAPQDWILSKQTTGFLSSLMLLGFYISLSLLHGLPNGYWFVLYIIGVIVCADSGAYFVGKKIGQKKLAPSISPGKTFEGVLGGMAVSLLFILAITAFLPNTFTGWDKFGFIIISLVSAALSVVGDLYESLIKRHAGIKDSGSLFPGHGGVLDRIDGLIAGSTFFVFGFFIILELHNKII